MKHWLKRNLAFARLGIQTNLEYRFNFFIDAIVQPAMTAGIEIFLWFALFAATNTETLNGYSKESYLAYVIWAAFVGRIAISWMYEHMMMDEIETGSINAIILRPMTFFEYYLSQLLGYKLVIFLFSSLVPLSIVLYFGLPTALNRLPLVALLIFYYLIFIHAMSFMTACLAFFLNRVRSFTLVKNFTIYIVSGELFPLDLLPTFWKKLFLNMPFAAGVYLPVGYLTNRISTELFLTGFINISIGLVVVLFLSYIIWRKGLRSYSGTGA
ncbi:MAG: ABC transporter permease [Bdellovibrionaceae bacterium]|nr:ABC transporter permease [Pseudobdellovibrionaceae bacterium]